MGAGETAIRAYQQRCFSQYKASVGLPEDYRYLYGNPVQVLVPVETAVGGVMVVGAYPSAKFFTVQGQPDMPLMDNDAPFSSETYFDGTRVRSIPSGQELENSYLKPLGLPRRQCWITDLVKVFLFKPGHVARYHKLGVNTVQETRSQFRVMAERSLPWLHEELELASPRLVFLLGVEVTSVVLAVPEPTAKTFLDGQPRPLQGSGQVYPAVCLPHPGILMRTGPANPWPQRFENEILPAARQAVEKFYVDESAAVLPKSEDP
jgi:uracil-DNA glycosylase